MPKDNSYTADLSKVNDTDYTKVNAAIIGGTGGLGQAISLYLASKGARVTVVGRTFRDQDKEGISFVPADLTLMTKAQEVAKELPAESLTHLIFTAGIFANRHREETDEGIERDMAVSYLNRLVLLREIAPRLGKNLPESSPKPRVFIMGYPGKDNIGTIEDQNFEKSYSAISTHLTTVAGNEILVADGEKRYPNLNIFGLNPGLIKTNIRNNYLGEDSFFSTVVEFIIGWTSKSPETYAKKISPLLVSEDLENRSGGLFDNNANTILASKGLNEEYNKKFLTSSEETLTKSGFTFSSKGK